MGTVTPLDNCSAPVHFEVRDGLGIVSLANPPVNSLRHTLRAGLAAALTTAGENDDISGIVIVGDGKGFCGGADLQQFGTPAATAEPTLPDLLAMLARISKPVIAAIHGFALGGGLELALACHYRLTRPDARLGFPEVGVGLIPGAGGTQRLPRLIGVEAALRMIQQEASVSGAEAVVLGLTDACFDGDPVDAAAKLLKQRSSSRQPGPLVDNLPPASARGVNFDTARGQVHPNARNRAAQLAAIDAVETATRHPFEVGMVHERAAFLRLLTSPEAVSLRHLRLSEKSAARAVDVGAGISPRAIRKVAVVGAGTMGSGIAMAFANSGFPVTVVEQNPEALDLGMRRIRTTYETSSAKGKLTPKQARERKALIQPSLHLIAVADADLVVEAIHEDMDAKKGVFKTLDAICRPGAILASNTSRLNLNEIAATTRRPHDVIGLHFFSPANVMKLVEVVRGSRTGDDVVVSGLNLVKELGKLPVIANVGEGFIGNRMLTPYRREADFLLEEGASPHQIDTAIKNFGFAMGPCAMSDLAGLDIAWAARTRLAPMRPQHLRYSRVADTLCEKGRFGQKSGKGYFQYEEGNRTAIPDPYVDEIIKTCAIEDGIERRIITDEEIVDRCILALVNEGAFLLEEGIAQRASDIDVVYVHGFGFPAQRGGPMHYANTVGLDIILKKIRYLQTIHGEIWTPAELLVDLVNAGRITF